MRLLNVIILVTTLSTTGYSNSLDTISVSKNLGDTLTIQASDTLRLADSNNTTIIIRDKEDKDIYDYIATIISSIIVPLIIGILAYLIGHKQVSTQKYQIRLDLLERRMKIYETIRKTLNEIDRDFSVLNVDTEPFFESKRHSKFLFNKEVQEFIVELDKRIIWLQQIEPKIEGKTQLSADENVDTLKARKKEMIEWLKSQQPDFEANFEKFMTLNKI